MERLISETAMVALFPTPPVRIGDNLARPWYSDYGNLIRLANYLKDQGEGAETLVRLMEKPWSFTEQWHWMLMAEGD